MRKRNPLSDKRRNFLQKRFAGYSNIDQLLDWTAEADPTHSGEYSSWILQMQLDRQIIMPEDIEKVQDKLRLFTKVKPRMPVELRDINTYQSYGQLAATTDQYASSERLQVSAEEVSGIEIVGEHYQENNKLVAIKVTTPRPATILAEGTEWCVKSPRFAKQYLDMGPLYFIDLNDRRFLLAHIDSSAKNPAAQIMDVYDEPINSKTKAMVTPLFKKFLPQFICDKHPDGQLQTEECPECSKHGLCSSVYCLFKCDFKKCKAEGCNDCIKNCPICEAYACGEHQQNCSHCHNIFCLDCVERCYDPKLKLSYSKVCHDCSENLQCKNCGGIFCNDEELTSCEICQDILCRECVGYCITCSLGFCAGHANLCQTSGCNNIVCKECDVPCYCGNTTCEFCQNTCSNCEEVVCADCFGGEVCIRCEQD